MFYSYQIKGNCFHKRVLFTPDLEKGQKGIRIYSKSLGAFLKCFGKRIEKIEAKGKILYLDGKSFDKWARRNKTEASIPSAKIETICAPYEIVHELSRNFVSSNQTEPTLYLVGGYQGAGKTSLIKRIQNIYDANVISTDAIRQNLMTRGIKASPQVVSRIYENLIKHSLSNRANTIIDANAHANRLKEIDQLLIQNNFKAKKVKIFLKASEGVLRNRIRNREPIPGCYQGTEKDLEGSLELAKMHDKDYDLIVETDNKTLEQVQDTVIDFLNPKLKLDLSKIQKVFEDYTQNDHAGLTLVMGHPFSDKTFLRQILKEQNSIREVFAKFHLEDALVLYDADTQIHSTLIELASQHNKVRNDQSLLEEEELSLSSKTKKLMNINFFANWIQRTAPFEIELGPGVLSEDHADQTLRITDSGQIVMKGRAKDRKLLSLFRTEFEKEAGIVHKYGKEDDEFFFVIGYLKPDPRLLDSNFRRELEKCIHKRRQNIQMALKVDQVKVIMYQNYSLDKKACLWESGEFKLFEDCPQKNLLECVQKLIRDRKLFNKGENG